MKGNMLYPFTGKVTRMPSFTRLMALRMISLSDMFVIVFSDFNGISHGFRAEEGSTLIR